MFCGIITPMEEKTICAISTPLGNSAISIIRMSGSKSLKIANKFFSAKNLDYKKILPRFMYLGVFSNNEISEKCLMVYFKTPYSYTGEDLVEFQIHGGEFLARKILNVLSKECGLATPGEFSKRAFFNNKLSLDEAEGIVDVINAESEAELSSAYSLSVGRFNQKIKQYQDKLTEMLARVEVALDYPEHNDELITLNQIKISLEDLQSEISSLLKNSESGEKIKSGVNIAIAGSPNVGKSSLLNTLLEKDRAIVSSIAGTTRDTLSETIVYKGIKFNLTDTAGIRNESDEIEKIGIERAKNEINKADLVLFVVDLSRDTTKEEEKLLSTLNKQKIILILNKKDIKKNDKKFEGYEILEVSALTGENIERLKELIYQKTLSGKIDLSKIVLTNIRHINCLKNAEDMIEKTLKIAQEATLDIIAFELKNIWNELGKITGETETEEIINEIFSKFCLGK